jgi:hypothetical protein
MSGVIRARRGAPRCRYVWQELAQGTPGRT